MSRNSNILYKIDAQDTIVFINDAWDRFALANDAPEMTRENVLKRSLWDFIKDVTTVQLYRDILKIARTGKIMQFNFNCDSPDKIRSLEMIVSAEKNDGVQFQTRTLRIKQREPQNILDINVQRIERFINICGWCKSIEVALEEWKDLDEAISMLGLFKHDKLPRLTHGICKNCLQKMSRKVAEI
jgi:hypothetical protein